MQQWIDFINSCCKCIVKKCIKILSKINFVPMRALEFMTGHVIYDPADTYKFQLKTTLFRNSITTSTSN